MGSLAGWPGLDLRTHSDSHSQESKAELAPYPVDRGGIGRVPLLGNPFQLVSCKNSCRFDHASCTWMTGLERRK